MRFSVNYDLALLVRKEGSRSSNPAMDDVYLDVAHKCLVASDGIKMGVFPCEVEPGDTTGQIPIGAIMQARAIARRLAGV